MKRTPLKRTGKKKPKKAKKPTTSKAKKEAWMWMSRYVRLRDQLPDQPGYAKCCTCGRVCPIYGIKAIHAGHFVPGRRNAALYDEHNVHGSCYHCNVRNSGSWVEYERFIVSKYGREECERLKQLRFEVKPMSPEAHLAVAAVYKAKVEELGGWKG